MLNGWLDAATIDIEPRPERRVRLSTVWDPRSGTITDAGIGAADYANVIERRRQNGTNVPYEPEPGSEADE